MSLSEMDKIEIRIVRLYLAFYWHSQIVINHPITHAFLQLGETNGNLL